MRHVQLRAFHHVAVHGGFSRAAKALFLTQPAVSDQVRKLEEAYDILLFDRRHRQVTLTPQGRKLLEITNRLFEIESQAQDFLSESRALAAGTLRIVADSVSHMLPALARFRARHPGVRLVVQTGNSQSIVEKLRLYQADVGLLGEAPAAREFRILRLGASRLVAYVARDHPLAARASMTMAEILAHPLVLREAGSKTRRMFEERAAELGLKPRPAIEAEGRGAVNRIVAAGVGVGIVSEAEFERAPSLRAIPIVDCGVLMEEALICLRERGGGRLIRAFMDLAAEDAPDAPA